MTTTKPQSTTESTVTRQAEQSLEYAVWRIIPSKPGCVDFCGTVTADCLESAEIIARLMYPVSGSDYLEVEDED